MKGRKRPELIRAAGGLIWREDQQRREILVIHRDRYDDWTLPKGKMKDGERWEETALREVEEETGYQAELVSFADSLFYYVSEKPKLVLFWNMRVTGRVPQFDRVTDSPDEGDQVEWLTVDQAVQKVTHEGEKALIKNEAEHQALISK